MKKLLFNLTILLYALLFTNVNASSFNANIVGKENFENEITLYIQVSNLVDFDGACNGLCGLVGNLNYDKDKIELTSISALENFDLMQGNTLVLYKSTGVSSGTKVLSMNFKNKSLSKGETTTITLSNIVASDGDKDISASNASKTIKFIAKETTNNNNTNKNHGIQKSDNNYLSSIALSEGNIEFDKNILAYDVIVDYETTIIEIKANAEDNNAIITGNGNHTLNVGKNVIKINVKSEKGSERTYTLNINRKEKNIIVGNEIIEVNTIEKDNNNVIPIVIILVIFVIGIVGFVILKNKKNK